MNICVKYCGGCNPRYDRKKIIEYLNNDFQEINIILQADIGVCDFVVVISGCRSSCVNHDNIDGKYGKFVVKDIKDYEILKETISEIMDKKI
jgi:4-hydroxybutyrate CoA-transferase